MRRYSGMIAFLLLVALFAWGQEIRQLTISPSMPGASGTLGISHDTSGTTYVSIQVKNIAKPDALQPAKAAYVVWIQPPGQPPQNHGVLQVNDKEQAQFTTTTSARNFDLFVTAEDDPHAVQPSGQQLLSVHK